MIKRRRNITTIVLSVFCILFAGMIGLQLFFYYQLKTRYDQAEAKIQEYDGMITQAQEEIESLKLQLEEKDDALSEKEVMLQEAQKEQQNTQEGQGTLSPSQGTSVFSSGFGSSLNAGEIIEYPENIDTYFQAYTIEREGEVFNRINGKSYRDNDNVALEDLRYLKLLHYNFDHEIQVGEMIVNAQLQDDVLQIFRELFENEYEIQSVYLVDNYWAGDGDSSDYASIEANNTSCFNYRVVTGGGNLSQHAYGCAIDINPQQNPYVSSGIWSHENASAYIDRSSGDPHVIVGGDICCSVFEKYGFSWGGYWQDPIDYQHFEKRI